MGMMNGMSVGDVNVGVLVEGCDDENEKVDLDRGGEGLCGKIWVWNKLYEYGIGFSDSRVDSYCIYCDLVGGDINKLGGMWGVVVRVRKGEELWKKLFEGMGKGYGEVVGMMMGGWMMKVWERGVGGVGRE